MDYVGEQQERDNSTKATCSLLRQHTFPGQRKKNKYIELASTSSVSQESHIIPLSLYHARFCSSHVGYSHLPFRFQFMPPFHSQSLSQQYRLYWLLSRMRQSRGEGWQLPVGAARTGQLSWDWGDECASKTNKRWQHNLWNAAVVFFFSLISETYLASPLPTYLLLSPFVSWFKENVFNKMPQH